MKRNNTNIIQQKNTLVSTPCSESGYLSLSSRFSKHLNSVVLKKNNGVHYLFLTGDAGCGKTEVLRNEFLYPLKARNITLCLFNFLPDKKIHNHFFLNDLVHQLIKSSNIAEHHPEVYKRLKCIKPTLKKNHTVHLNQPELLKDFTEILTVISETEKVVFLFEDIHLSGKNFGNFLSTLSKINTTVDIHVISSTRKNKTKHTFSFSSNQLWMKISQMSEQSVSKFRQSLLNSNGTIDTLSSNLLYLSGGSPFYLKELHLLDIQKQENKNCASTCGFGKDIEVEDQNDQGAITALRFHYLHDRFKTILKILCTLGSECDYKVFKKILSEFNVTLNGKDLEYLANIGFIHIIGKTMSFQHHLIYESVQRNLSRSEILDLNRVVFFYYNRNKSNTTLENLTKHAAIAKLYSHAGIYAKQLADRLYIDGHYELSLEYYEYYLDHLAECSSKEKLIARTTNVFVKVQSLHVILGSYADMKSTSHTLIELSEKTTVKQKLEIYTALTRSSWVLGNLHEAQGHAQKNIDIAQKHGIHDAEIAASFRYGSIHSELGHFLKTLTINKNIQQQITPEEYEQKFGLFPMLYPGVTSINSICHAELGNYDESLKYCNLSADFVHGCSDKFTKIFVGVHVGYSLFLLGRLSDALSYLQDVQKIIKTTKTSLFAIECQSMIGVCQLYLGHYDKGAENVKTAYDLTNTTLQGNKQGMSDLHYLESLLVQFDTEQFSKIINVKIKEAKSSGQESYVAWMYFLKAIYKAFYKRSLTGFVGALAESSKRAQELQMGALLDNIIYLTRIEKTGLLGFQDKAQPTRLLNKAEFFFGLTQDIKPIYFHKKD